VNPPQCYVYMCFACLVYNIAEQENNSVTLHENLVRQSGYNPVKFEKFI
jgi:hypothetical protein